MGASALFATRRDKVVLRLQALHDVETARPQSDVMACFALMEKSKVCIGPVQSCSKWFARDSAYHPATERLAQAHRAYHKP